MAYETVLKSMAKALIVLAVAGGAEAAAPQAASPPPPPSQALPGSFSPLIERVKPAVVNIATTELETAANRQELPQFPQFPPGSPFRNFFQFFGMPGPQSTGPLTALGSGFIIDPAGYIVTNNHVIRNGTKIAVTLQDGTTLDAQVVGHDKLTDLALLKVNANHPLPFVEWGDSGKAAVGDWVVCVGNPFGLGGTVTAGILSARGRNIRQQPYDQFLQIDAPINQGNSGGPTFDEKGNVIGINTAILSPGGGGSIGIGFAIPSDLAKPVIEDLKRSGKVVRGWLGVTVEGITPATEDALGVHNTNGAVVASITPGGPAAQSGMKPGDVILKFGANEISHVRDLTWDVANTPPGKTVPVDLLRNGKQTSLKVTVGQLNEGNNGQHAAAAGHSSASVGLQLETLDVARQQGFDLPQHIHGAFVLNVVPGSPADQSGVRPGDVIQQVGHVPVNSPGQARQAIDAAEHKGQQSVALNLNRGGQEEFLPMVLPRGRRS